MLQRNYTAVYIPSVLFLSSAYIRSDLDKAKGENPMMKAEVIETMLYGCVTWSPRASHYDTLRRALHSFLTRCIGWRKRTRTDHRISYLETLVKTGSESIEATLRKKSCLCTIYTLRCIIFLSSINC